MREPRVTRTITSTIITALTVDLINGTTSVKEFTLPREYKDDKEIIKYCTKHIDNDEIKVVKILESKVVEKLYGMSEQEFISLAKPIEKTKETK